MNFKTFIILFLLGISCSCAITHQKNLENEREDNEVKRNLFEPRISTK